MREFAGCDDRLSLNRQSVVPVLPSVWSIGIKPIRPDRGLVRSVPDITDGSLPSAANTDDLIQSDFQKQETSTPTQSGRRHDDGDNRTGECGM